MTTRARTRPQSVKSHMKHEKKGKVEGHEIKLTDAAKSARSRRESSKERKLALQQDVDNLKKMLRREETIHRALKRAFSRPLGALPRLPPCLPPLTLELLAEVAVLEEEVVRLEEQVVLHRQGLYQEAVYIASSKRACENSTDVCETNPTKILKQEQFKLSAQPTPLGNSAIATRSSSLLADDGHRKESGISFTKSNKGSSTYKSVRTPVKRAPIDSRTPEPQKSQPERRVAGQESAESRTPLPDDYSSGYDSPNKISEDILRCLSNIFLRMSSTKTRGSIENSQSISAPAFCEISNKESDFWDPYGICSEFGQRDIGPYKHLYAVEAGSINPKRMTHCLFLVRRLKLLLGKLASANLQKLNHHEKLAFWINVYNSCMMNAFIEHGIPESPDMVIPLMQKATINVGGHFLNPITIEHFILRLPYHSIHTFSKDGKNDEPTTRSIFGLELSEPLVTFALSCGSWSSPSVRVYTAAEVEDQLEAAKREYLQAAVGFSTRKFAIPKLMGWYLPDYAKDLESLLDWICLQLPSELGKEAIKCLERARNNHLKDSVQVIPYDFRFRYLLYT